MFKKMAAFFKVREGLSKPKESSEAIEINSVFMNKILDSRFDFANKMLREGFRPNEETIGQIKDLFWFELGRNHVYKSLGFDEVRKEIGHYGLDNKNGETKNMLGLLKFLKENKYLDLDFLKRSQNSEVYFGNNNMTEVIDALVESKENIPYLGEYKGLSKKAKVQNQLEKYANMCMNGHLLTLEHSFVTGPFSNMPGYLFSNPVSLKNINKIGVSLSGNILEEIRYPLLKVSSDVWLDYLTSNNKEEFKGKIADFSIEDKSDLEQILIKDKSVLEMAITSLIPEIIQNEVNKSKYKPEEILSNFMSGSERWKDLSMTLIMLYPETLKKADEKVSLDAIEHLMKYISKHAYYNYTNAYGQLIDYTLELKSGVLEKRENQTLDKMISMVSFQQKESNDYLGFANRLGLPSNIVDILLIINNEVKSLTVQNKSIEELNKLEGLEKTLFNCLNTYSQLNEINSLNEKDIELLLKEPIVMVYNSIKEIKENTFNEKLDGLLIERSHIKKMIK